jgi:hypothetical protein
MADLSQQAAISAELATLHARHLEELRNARLQDGRLSYLPLARNWRGACAIYGGNWLVFWRTNLNSKNTSLATNLAAVES